MNEEILSKEEFETLLHEASENKSAMIAMFKDKDGNWRGSYYKEGTDNQVFARQAGPETVLQLLLTHDGKPHTKTE